MTGAPMRNQTPSCLDILNQLLGGGVDRSLGVRHILDGAGPAGGLIEQFGVEPIAMLSTIYRNVPVPCESSIKRQVVSANLGPGLWIPTGSG